MVGSVMSNQTAKLTIGGIGLNLTAVPDQVKFGLKEGMNVHKLVGGARVVDMTGDDPDNFVFSGTWLGPNASDNMNAMYKMEQAKQLVQLSFGPILRNGVVAASSYVYKRAYWIDFTIEFLVVEDVATIGILGGNFGFNAIEAQNGDAAIAAANAAVINAATDAANALAAGVAGIAQVVAAGGVAITNLLNF